MNGYRAALTMEALNLSSGQLLGQGLRKSKIIESSRKSVGGEYIMGLLCEVE